jgi:CheY-like chemotaxis protein
VAVVALTGNAMDADAQDMLAAGCDVVLKKPTSRDELRGYLAAQFDRCWPTFKEADLLPRRATTLRPPSTPTPATDDSAAGGDDSKRKLPEALAVAGARHEPKLKGSRA